MEREKILRINELSKKSKEAGLTAEEKIEQEKLRKEYIADCRANLEHTLAHTYIMDSNGNKRKLQKKGETK